MKTLMGSLEALAERLNGGASHDGDVTDIEAGPTHHPAQSSSPGEAGWPPGVRPISAGGMDLLGVGNDGRLYWDGIPIEVTRTFALSWWQRVGAITVAVATVVAAIAAVVGAIAAARTVPAVDVANDRRCLAIQRDMLSARPRRADASDLFQALGCRPRGEGSVYGPPPSSSIEHPITLDEAFGG